MLETIREEALKVNESWIIDPPAAHSRIKKKKAQPASISFRSINAVKEVDVTGVQLDRVHVKNGPPFKTTIEVANQRSLHKLPTKQPTKAAN